MSVEINIFRPTRLKIGMLCFMILTAILINLYSLLESHEIPLYFSLFLLLVAFVYLFVPLLKNQKLVIENENIKLFSFGNSYDLTFASDLFEIVVKDSEVISYRLKKEGMYFQISPYAYYDGDELNGILNDLYSKVENPVSIVER
jgi:hypothetical protein